MRNVFKLVWNGDDFDFSCVEGDWHCEGFSILKRGTRYYVQAPSQKEKNEAFAITKSYFLKELYGWFEEPNTKEMSKMPHWEWEKLAEANADFIRAIYLNEFWNLKDKKSA